MIKMAISSKISSLRSNQSFEKRLSSYRVLIFTDLTFDLFYFHSENSICLKKLWFFPQFNLTQNTKKDLWKFHFIVAASVNRVNGSN